jgi:FAD/FMN-containing dehydrogenase
MRERTGTWGAEAPGVTYQDYTDESCCYRFHRYSKDADTWRYELLVKHWDGSLKESVWTAHIDVTKPNGIAAELEQRRETEAQLNRLWHERTKRMAVVGHRRIVHVSSDAPKEGLPETVDELRKLVIELRKRADDAETRARRAEGGGALAR